MASRAPRKSKTRTRLRTHARGGATERRWSQRVTDTSDAMDLQPRVFTQRSAGAIARSLKRSAERSSRRKSTPYASAMSMLTFEINRAGKTMTETRRRRLEAAKTELRRLFGRDPAKTAGTSEGRKRASTGRR